MGEWRKWFGMGGEQVQKSGFSRDHETTMNLSTSSGENPRDKKKEEGGKGESRAYRAA